MKRRKTSAFVEKLIGFFRISKRKLLIFIVMFYVFFFYLPLVKCIDSVAVKEKFCKIYGLCETDFYFSVFGIMSSYNPQAGRFLCPSKNLTIFAVILLVVLVVAMAYFLTCFVDVMYRRFRDK